MVTWTRRLLRVTATAVAGGAAAVTWLPGTAHAAGPRYAALGDSYASGWGAGAGIPTSPECGRSANAYGRLWAESHAHQSFQNLTCKGAYATDVAYTQVSQMSAATTMVTVTAGGNDANFQNTMIKCRGTVSTGSGCGPAMDESIRLIDNVVPGRMDTMFARLTAKLPNTATVYVLGYPRLYTEVPHCGLFSIDPATRHKLNLIADWLNSQIRQSVTKADGRYPERIVFIDVRGRFADHSLCSASSYILGPHWPGNLDTSYHPNAAGHRNGYFSALRAVTG